MTLRGLTAAGVLAAAGAAWAQPVDVFDGFVDGGVTLTSAGVPTGGNYSAPSVPAGRRSVTFFNSNGSGELVIDAAAGEVRFDTTGLGQFTVAYGWQVVSGGAGMVNSYPNRLDADWSDVAAIRIPVLRNGSSLRYRVDVGTQRIATEPDPFEGSSSTALTTVGGGFTGVIDVPLSAFSTTTGGGVDWSDVDRVSIFVSNGFVSSDLTLGAIQLVRATAPEDLDGDGAVGASDLALLIGSWGVCPADAPCPADLDGDGAVGASDLARVIGAWG